MVVGEAQILGQLKAVYRTAVAAGAVGRTLHELVQHALRAGKRVHAETAIDHVGASMIGAALADATAALGELDGRRAMVIGAGAMAGIAAAGLRRAGIGEVTVVNRTAANGLQLAQSLADDGVPAYATGSTCSPNASPPPSWRWSAPVRTAPY